MRTLRFFVGVFFFLLFQFYPLFAQKDKSYFDLSNPRATVTTHLLNLQSDTYHPEFAAKTLQANSMSEEQKIEFAIKIKQIFDGRGLYINTDFIPSEPNFRDSTDNKYIIVESFPQIYLVKEGNEWLYSNFTISKVNEIHQQIYPFGTHRLLEVLQKTGISTHQHKLLGISTWQWISLLLLIIVCYLFHKIFTFISRRILTRILKKMGYQNIAHEIILPVAKPLSLLIVFAFTALLFPVLQLPIALSRHIIFFLKATTPIFAIIVLYRLTDVFTYYFKVFASKTENTLDDQLVPVVNKLIKVLVIVGGFLFILQNLNFNITGLIAGLSIGGLAFALAAQDTIKNLFGSLMIFVDRPFQVGDWIVADGIDGTVEEVGIRSTRVRTFHNSVVSVPNGKIADMTVDNMGMRVYRRFKTYLAVTYDTPPDKIEIFVEGLKKIVLNHPQTRKDFYEIHMNSFGDFSLNILFYIFFTVPTWSEELKIRHEIILEVIKLAEKLEVRFAFPTNTLHVENFPEKESLTPVNEATKEDLLQRLNLLENQKKES